MNNYLVLSFYLVLLLLLARSKKTHSNDKLYWCSWGASLGFFFSFELNEALFFYLFSTSIFYVLFQSVHDSKGVKRLFCALLFFDFAYLLFSPTVINTSNVLLVAPTNVEAFGKYLDIYVPLSLSLKLFAHSISYIKERRNNLLCMAEFLFVSFLVSYKFEGTLYIDPSDWTVISYIFVTIIMILLLSSILKSYVSFQTVVVQTSLGVAAYLAAISKHDFNIVLACAPVGIVLAQGMLRDRRSGTKVIGALFLMLIPLFSFMAIQVADPFYHFSLFIVLVGHIFWLYSDLLRHAGEKHAS